MDDPGRAPQSTRRGNGRARDPGPVGRAGLRRRHWRAGRPQPGERQASRLGPVWRMDQHPLRPLDRGAKRALGLVEKLRRPDRERVGRGTGAAGQRRRRPEPQARDAVPAHGPRPRRGVRLPGLPGAHLERTLPELQLRRVHLPAERELDTGAPDRWRGQDRERPPGRPPAEDAAHGPLRDGQRPDHLHYARPAAAQRQNIGRTRTLGGEVDLTARPWEQVSITAGYAYADSVVTSFPGDPTREGRRLPAVSRHQVTLTLTLGHPDRVQVMLLGRYLSRQFADDLNTQPVADFVVLDASIQKKLGRFVRLFLDAENLTDRQYIATQTGAIKTLGAPFLVLAGLSLEY